MAAFVVSTESATGQMAKSGQVQKWRNVVKRGTRGTSYTSLTGVGVEFGGVAVYTSKKPRRQLG
jgi:hypothetical protein